MKCKNSKCQNDATYTWEDEKLVGDWRDGFVVEPYKDDLCEPCFDQRAYHRAEVRSGLENALDPKKANV